MPGISQGYSMAAHANIDRAMRDAFNDSKLLEDAIKILRLTEKAHVWEDRMLESHIQLMRFMFWVLSGFIVVGTFVDILTRPTQLDWAMALFWSVPILTFCEFRWSKKRCLNAKEEISLLIKSDPNYWEPLIDRIKQIVINHGNAEHSLIGSRQVTRLTDTKS